MAEGDPQAPFSLGATTKCRGGCYSIPWIAPLYPWSLPYHQRQHQVPFFESLVWLNLRLNPGLLDHWRTLYLLGHWPNAGHEMFIIIWIKLNYLSIKPEQDCLHFGLILNENSKCKPNLKKNGLCPAISAQTCYMSSTLMIKAG